MGRRALRKTDPSLDLSHHLRTEEELPQPWNPEALFGRCAPLEVEIGTGKGLFLRTVAPEQPATNFLGLEIASKYASFAAAGLAKRKIENAVVVIADATRVFSELLPDSCLSAIHIYFPDPWWKKRHKKRRVIRESFVAHLERTLQIGGHLHFWTDVQEYFEVATELLIQLPRLEGGPLAAASREALHDMDYRTHFERRTRLDDKPVYRAEYCKSKE